MSKSRDEILRLVTHAETQDQAQGAVQVALSWLDLHPNDDEIWELIFKLIERCTTPGPRSDATCVQGKSGLWRWTCQACGSNGRRWYHRRNEAIEAGRDHVHEPHDSSATH